MERNETLLLDTRICTICLGYPHSCLPCSSTCWRGARTTAWISALCASGCWLTGRPALCCLLLDWVTVKQLCD